MTMTRAGRTLTLMALAACLAAGHAAAEPARPAGTVDWDAASKEAIDLLQRYVRIPSVNPPADTRATAAFLREILEKEGIEVRLFESTPGKVNLLARLAARSPAPGGRPRPLMLLHHMDVVPVDRARWPKDPFGGELSEGFIHGRGTADMKGIGILHLMTLLTLRREQVPLHRDVLLMATADEETGGHGGARWMIEHLGEELNPEFVLDEGGFGARDVVAADGRLVFAISVGEKQVLWLKVIATGTAGHGSQPLADNANDRLSRYLDQVHRRAGALPPRRAGPLRELAARVGDLSDNKFMRAVQRDTVSLTTLRSGVGEPPKVNVIPSVAEATFDCRLLPDTDLDRFLDEVFPAAGADGLSRELIYRMDDTPVSPHTTEMFQALERAIRDEHPDAVVAPTLIPYGTDGNLFRGRGAATYGINPMVVDAGIIASMHSDAERVPADQIARGARILYEAVRRVAAENP